jgi:hypothetical protein
VLPVSCDPSPSPCGRVLTGRPARRADPRLHPQTPERTQRMPTRAWAGRVRNWRRALHDYHPEAPDPATGPPSAD